VLGSASGAGTLDGSGARTVQNDHPRRTGARSGRCCPLFGHGRPNLGRRGGSRSVLPARPSPASTVPLRRAARPARWPSGTPTRPAGDVPGGTRSASGAAAGAPRDGWGDTSHRARCQIRRKVGSDGNNSSRSSRPRSQRAYLAWPGSFPVRLKISTTDSGIKAHLPPGVQRRIPENARSSHFMQIPANSGNFRRTAKPAPHFP
jgi:hypothetical protein